MPRRRNEVRRLVHKALQTQGPLSDGQLCWWLQHFGVAAASAVKARAAMTRRGVVRFARRFIPGRKGRFAMLWELGPEDGLEQSSIDLAAPTPEQRAKSKAIFIANEAIDALKRIPKNDPLRKRGFQIVTDWIRAHS